MSFSDLPLVSDLLPSHKCKGSRDGSPCTCKFVPAQRSEPVIADKRLLHWQEWMQRRKELHQRLGRLLQRDPGSLVMNSGEEYRPVKEKQIAMQYTKIPQPDQYRGCPGFWKMPIELKNDDGGETSCFAVLSKEDRCEIPVIEHVGVSQQTMKEKDVLPRIRNPCKVWEESTYVQQRIVELGSQVQLVDPYKPDFDELFIKGSSVRKLTISKPPPDPTSSQVQAVTIENALQCVEEKGTVCLLINGFQISPQLDISGTRKVYVVFDYDIATGKVATEYLTITNQGTTAIRFYWKATEKVELFKDIIPEKKAHQVSFYFNKNEELIIPGQTISSPIWFKTENPGTYCEFWEFCTKPNVLSANAHLVITLHASAVIGDLDGRMNAIRERLDNNVRERLIKEALSAVLTNVPYEKFKPTIYSYNKREVFESVNSKYDPLNQQPKYLYNKDVVRELQKFYKKVRRRLDPKCWNYRIDELRLLASAREKKEEHLKSLAKQQEAEKVQAESPKLPTLACEKTVFPNISAMYTKQHVSHEEKTGTQESSVDKNKKNGNGNLQKEAVADAKPLTEQLEVIIAKLERPAVEQNFQLTIYNQAYLILCTCFNKVSEEFEVLREKLGIIKKTKYPKFPKTYMPPLFYRPPRLIQERLHDVFEKPALTEKVGSNVDKPAAEILQNIPPEECKRRFRTYYGIPDTPPPQSEKGGRKKGKGDKKGDKKDKKGGKGDKKDNKKGKKGASKNIEKAAAPESDEDDGYVINELFDPYAKTDLPPLEEEFVEEEIEEDVVQSNTDNVPAAIMRQYKYNTYVIMYNYLEKAVTNIVDMIEMQPRENVPYAVIKEIEEPNYNRRLIDLKGLLVQENIDKLKAKLILYNYQKKSKIDWKAVEIQRQLRTTASEASLWSILKPYEAKPKLPEEKPISYPMDHYEDVTQVTRKSTDQDDRRREEPPVMVNDSTSTLDGRLDPNWEDFKDVAVQKDYTEEDLPDDLETYVERVISEISAQDLIDIRPDKETQKNFDEYVSDEEYFYHSDEGESDSSINSQRSTDDSCSCEGEGVCNEYEENGDDAMQTEGCKEFQDLT